VFQLIAPNQTVGEVIARCDLWHMSLLGQAVQSVHVQGYPHEQTVVFDYNGAFQAVSGFREEVSKIGGAAMPGDTELFLWLGHDYGASGQWPMVPSAPVEHPVPAHRATLRYVVDRRWSEGAGMGAVTACAGAAFIQLGQGKAA
jgi:hypothetical protein